MSFQHSSILHSGAHDKGNGVCMAKCLLDEGIEVWDMRLRKLRVRRDVVLASCLW